MKSHFFNSTLVIAALAAVTFVSCGKDDASTPVPPPYTPTDPTKPDDPPAPKEDSLPAVNPLYAQQYRPQVHFTPQRNWMNDPNGMVYVDGTWHLFYQYNPQGNDWGNMSWGHATSRDLMHWDEQPVALVRDRLGDVFSGSAVIDKDNTAGFGAGTMVVFYTCTDPIQQQAMAYSRDGGKNFTRYDGNPVIPNDKTGEFSGDFRDPKVIWHEGSRQWIMSLARGSKHEIEFYGSKNLRDWQYLSTFSTPDYGRCNGGQWECPDLFEIDGKWVLIVSTNPGGPISGSGTMYFLGEFDGTNFTADSYDYPLWLDYGMDNYAGVTFSNTGDRRVFIGWMNNWNYAGAVPCNPWRSAMTLPRDLTLTDVDGKPYLACKVSEEISAIAGEWKDVSDKLPAAYAYHIQVPLDLQSDHTVYLGNDRNEYIEITTKAGPRTISLRRNEKSGRVDFNGTFPQFGMRAFVPGSSKELTLDIYVDQSSVEIVSADGLINITNLVFPTSIYNNVKVDGSLKGRVRTLKSIWSK